MVCGSHVRLGGVVFALVLVLGLRSSSTLNADQPVTAFHQRLEQLSSEHVHKTHDLSLPAWGPYTKTYAGISHITDPNRGLRFDLSVFPGYYRRRLDPPAVMWESGHYPWEASTDLTYYSYRHELEWKDQVYCDIAYARVDDQGRLVRCELVNRTDRPQAVTLHAMASMNFPAIRPNSTEALQLGTVRVREGAIWLHALDYRQMGFAKPRPQDNLTGDGYFRGEIRDHGLVDGSALGRGFGKDKGDRVAYRIDLTKAIPNAIMEVRYRLPAGSKGASFAATGLTNTTLTLKGNDGIQTQRLSLGDLAAGQHDLTLVSRGIGAVDLLGFVLAPATLEEPATFGTLDWEPRPRRAAGPTPSSLLLNYPDTDMCYGLAWDYPVFEVREIVNSELDRFLRYKVHNHVDSVLTGDKKGHFTNLFLRPIELKPKSSRVLFMFVCNGTREQVKERLVKFADGSIERENVHARARAKAAMPMPNPAGEAFRFSQDRMAATTLTNVVFPVYTQRQYIRHNTPGRWWDSLYTWDSGFVALGMAELDPLRSVDCLNAYVTDPGNTHAAFIHHGSLVPVQPYVFLELWNRTQSRELLEYFYPRLQQYYRFYTGRLGSSTTRNLKSNLLRTWDYFYNSGGWDDYPPQKEVHARKLEAIATPVANTAHAIRFAKILRMAAEALGRKEDLAEYDQDIRDFTVALQRFSWDEQAGYFSYVLHDPEGRPSGILRHSSGANFNMGMDGATPLTAGICTADQEHRLVSHLMSEKHMWSRVGLSTVDQSAPYYRIDGYWNGAVWFPHQWFFWKSMLDLGHGEEALRIAQRGLDVWKAEVDDSYLCFEHFIVATGRGAGWHHFGGLSTPVLSWYMAYFQPGRLTVGFDTWVISSQFEEGNRGFRGELKNHVSRGRSSSAVLCLSPDSQYEATWNGHAIGVRSLFPGTVILELPGGGVAGTLVVKPIGK